jgi:hypothetical protein
MKLVFGVFIDGEPVTGAAADVTVKLRDTDQVVATYWDWTSAAWLTVGWTLLAKTMTEIDAVNAPGFYSLDLPIAALDALLVPSKIQVIYHYDDGVDEVTETELFRTAIDPVTSKAREYETVVHSIAAAVKLKTDNLPADPASELAVTGAITASEGNIRGTDADDLKALSDQLDAVPDDTDVEADAAAALAAYGAAKTSDVTGSESVITGAIGGLENISTGDVETAVGTALGTYTAAKTGDLAALALAGEAAAAAATIIGGDGDTLETLSDQIDGLPTDSDVEASTGAALATYTAAKTGDLAGLAVAGEAAAALVAYNPTIPGDLAGLATSVQVAAVPAAASAEVTAAHGVGPYNAGASSLTAQETCDAVLKLVPTAGALPAGSLGEQVEQLFTDIGGVASGVADIGAVVVTRASMADDGSTARFSVWLEHLGVRMTTISAISGTIVDKDGALVVDLGAGVGPSADGTFSFACVATSLPFGVPLALRTTSTDGASTWYGSIGFARS